MKEYLACLFFCLIWLVNALMNFTSNDLAFWASMIIGNIFLAHLFILSSQDKFVEVEL